MTHYNPAMMEFCISGPDCSRNLINYSVLTIPVKGFDAYSIHNPNFTSPHIGMWSFKRTKWLCTLIIFQWNDFLHVWCSTWVWWADSIRMQVTNIYNNAANQNHFLGTHVINTHTERKRETERECQNTCVKNVIASFTMSLNLSSSNHASFVILLSSWIKDVVTNACKSLPLDARKLIT